MADQPAPANPPEADGDGVLQTLVGIGDDQPHPTEAPGIQRAQEGQPEGAVLAGAHVHAQYLSLTGAVHAGGHHTLTFTIRPPSRTFWVNTSNHT